MKIKSYLNNVFDQYDQEENRITNAFLQTLAKNRDLLKAFLEEYLNIHLSKSANVIISSQKEPFGTGDEEEDREKVEGIPDGWIIIDEKKAIVFETKIVRNAIRHDQLFAHVKRIRGYAHKYLCVITPDEESLVTEINIPNTDIKWISWRDIYQMINKKQRGVSGVAGYLINELKEYLAMKEDLIGFSGINYSSNEYNTLEAKFILKALLREIGPEIRKIFPNFSYEKKAVSERGHAYTVHHRSIWSCLSEEKDFTLGLHLTFWLHQTHFGMGITVPNRAGKYWKRLKTICKSDELFNDFTNRILELRKKVPHLYIEFLQRHYKGMTDAIVDGIVEVDVDTISGNSKYHIRPNSLWYDVIRDLVQNKKSYNGQLMIRVRFFYKDHDEIITEKFRDTLIAAAANFKEVYDYLQEV